LGGYWLKVENSQRGYFYGNLQVRQDDDKLNARMAGTSTLYVLVDGGTDDTIKNPAVLTAMERVQDRLAHDPRVGKTLSIVDFLKRMNQAMNADKADFYRLPASRDLVAQYLLLYSNSGEPQDFDSYVDSGYRKADIHVFLKTDDSIALAEIVRATQAYADSVFPAGVRVRIGGGVISSLALSEEMVRSKVLNILQILGSVFLISMIIFRSVQAGFLILVPLVATVFVNFGVMGLIGIPLNIPTSLVSAMAVGIGADYAIYLSFRMREELRSGIGEAEGLRAAFLSAGKAAIFVSTAVAGGFGVLVFSWGFNMHVWMGFLIALAMLVSSFSTLTVFASLILTLRPKFIFSHESVPVLQQAEAIAR
jgi:predicted RND superfamily exporter protein